MSEILDQVVRILTDIIGEDFLLDTTITADMTFGDDLALESIEFVELTARLQERFGEWANLAAFMADMDIYDIMSLTVGQVAEYIESAQAAQAQLADRH
jgi:acyl carrier protein